MIKAGIIGGAGYTAGELTRLLVNHPEVEIGFIHSESNAGNPVSSVHEGLIGDTDLVFASSYDLSSVDVLFLCGAHGKSAGFWAENSRPEGLKVIDLAQDFRDESCGYVYGLPEWQRSRIVSAQSVANPGCFATAIQLALLPLASQGLIRDEVQVTAITGSTGAGVKPGATTHFSWRNNNISTYKVFSHQHLLEICRNLNSIQNTAVYSGAGVPSSDVSLRSTPPGGPLPLTMPRVARSAEGTPAPEVKLNFVPVRGDFARGIFASVYTSCELTEEQAAELYNEYYKDAAFTFVSGAPVDLKQVVNTNKCVLHVEKHGDKLVVSSVIDNLLKGASGQALQNMNIMFGICEKSGLRLKASAF